MKRTFRTSDIIARLGGDEFVVLAIDTSDHAEETILQRLQDYLVNHNLQENRAYQLSVSAGITRFDPDQPCTLDELLERGDKAMYEQKQAKKRVFTNHMD